MSTSDTWTDYINAIDWGLTLANSFILGILLLFAYIIIKSILQSSVDNGAEGT